MENLNRISYNNSYLSDGNNILTLSPPDPIWNDLSAYYRLENNMLDSVGNAHGTGVVNWSSSGKNGSCLSVDGTKVPNKYMQVPDNTGVNLTGDFSISLWVNPYAYPQENKAVLIKKENVFSQANYFLSIESDGTILYRMDNIYGNWAVLYSPTGYAIPLNTWTNIIITFNLVIGCRLFINGIEPYPQRGYPVNNTPRTSNDPVWIGGWSKFEPALGQWYMHNWLNGYIDEVAIWKRALLSSEITAISQGLFY